MRKHVITDSVLVYFNLVIHIFSRQPFYDLPHSLYSFSKKSMQFHKFYCALFFAFTSPLSSYVTSICLFTFISNIYADSQTIQQQHLPALIDAYSSSPDSIISMTFANWWVFRHL